MRSVFVKNVKIAILVIKWLVGYKNVITMFYTRSSRRYAPKNGLGYMVIKKSGKLYILVMYTHLRIPIICICIYYITFITL